MPDPRYLAAAVAVSAAVTWALRALPFAVLAPLRRSALLDRLAAQLPAGVMLILALYTLRELPSAPAPSAASTVLALAAAVALHLKTRNAVVSVLGATALHVVLATLWQA